MTKQKKTRLGSIHAVMAAIAPFALGFGNIPVVSHAKEPKRPSDIKYARSKWHRRVLAAGLKGQC